MTSARLSYGWVNSPVLNVSLPVDDVEAAVAVDCWPTCSARSRHQRRRSGRPSSTAAIPCDGLRPGLGHLPRRVGVDTFQASDAVRSFQDASRKFQVDGVAFEFRNNDDADRERLDGADGAELSPVKVAVLDRRQKASPVHHGPRRPAYHTYRDAPEIAAATRMAAKSRSAANSGCSRHDAGCSVWSLGRHRRWLGSAKGSRLRQSGRKRVRHLGDGAGRVEPMAGPCPVRHLRGDSYAAVEGRGVVDQHSHHRSGVDAHGMLDEFGPQVQGGGAVVGDLDDRSRRRVGALV